MGIKVEAYTGTGHIAPNTDHPQATHATVENGVLVVHGEDGPLKYYASGRWNTATVNYDQDVSLQDSEDDAL